jgi:hypothetical protein
LKEEKNDEIEWVDEPPPIGQGIKNEWLRILQPLVRHPGRWAKVKTCETPERAQATASNLNRRIVNIPKPEAEWDFLSRGTEVFAKFRPRRTRASTGRNKRKA